MKKLLPACAAALLMASCATNGNSQKESDAEATAEEVPVSLIGQWFIDEINYNDTTNVRPAEIDVETLKYFTIDSDSTFSVATGCNQMFGSYTISGNTVTFNPMGLTRMACPDMTVEQLLVQILPDVTEVSVLNDTVVSISNPDANQFIVLRKSATPIPAE